MIKFYNCRKLLAIEINGHYRQDICNMISSITQFSQWVLPDLFVSFQEGKTFILARTRKEIKFIKKVVSFLVAFFEQNGLYYENVVTNKFHLKMYKDKVEFFIGEDAK